MGRRGALALLGVAAALAAVLLRASDTLTYAWMASTDPDSLNFSQVGWVLRLPLRGAVVRRLVLAPSGDHPLACPRPAAPYLSRPLPGRFLRWGMRWPHAGCRSCRPLCCRRTCTWCCSPPPSCPPKVR